MKKLILFVLMFASIAGIDCHATVPQGAIRFIYDSHLYLQTTLNQKTQATIIYDTAADLLHLDADFLRLNNLENAFGKKGKAHMRGAGNSPFILVETFIEPIEINCGDRTYKNHVTPIIELRAMLGRYADGILGNTHLLQSPLQINFSQGYILPLTAPISDKLHDEYRPLEVRFKNNRIYVKASLRIDDQNTVEGWFLLDLGSGSTISLTHETLQQLDLSHTPKASFSTQQGGIGGGSDEAIFRAANFTMGDLFENIVISASFNEHGALSKNQPYVGIIGNQIWSLYDLIIDPTTQKVWVKRNDNKGSYSEASTTHMAVVDRTDISEGWIVNGLYEGGIAQQAGIEIGDVILAINGRKVAEITWEEQRKGLDLKGETQYTVKKKSGETVTYTLQIQDPII